MRRFIAYIIIFSITGIKLFSQNLNSTDTVNLKDYLFSLPKISGYLQTGYDYNSFGEGTSSFQLKRLRLIIDKTITPKSYLKIQFEALNGVNIGSAWKKQKTFQVLDAYFHYSFSNEFQIRVGEFSSPAGYENYSISPLTNQTIDYASICTRMVLRNAVGYNYVDFGRDIGVMLMGNLIHNTEKNFDYLSYNVALTNGNLATADDNNKTKDIIAAVTVWPLKKWNIKFAYNWGEYQLDNFSGSYDPEKHPWNQVQGEKYLPLHRFIVGTWYNDPTGLILRSEFGRLTSNHNSIKLVDEIGFYFLAAYNVHSQWTPVIRYDYYKDKINSNSSWNRNRILLGCNYQPLKWIKIQLNYSLSIYDNSIAKVINNDRNLSNELQVMGLFSF